LTTTGDDADLDGPGRHDAAAAEEHYLGNLLEYANRPGTDPAWFVAAVADLRAEHFQRPANREIFTAVCDLWNTDPALVTPGAVYVALEDRAKTARPPAAAAFGVGVGDLTRIREAATTPGMTGHFAAKIRSRHLEQERDRTLETMIGAPAWQQQELCARLGDVLAQLSGATATADAVADPVVDGEQFLYSDDPETPSVWGEKGGLSLWADGESLMLAGPPGTGKSTLAHLLVFARLGLVGEVLGYPVADDGGKVLYLAMDRPRQLRRAMRRLARPDFHHRAVLRGRLVVHRGPLPVDVTKPENARYLLDLATEHGATTVVVDSLKDVLPSASDEVGAGGYNAARQHCLAAGVEWLEIHHNRKAGGDNKEPDKLDDIYGNRQITAGAGSVLSLFGEAGDAVVRLKHLKSPGEGLLPMFVRLDTEAGTLEPYERVELPDLLARAGGQGVTPAAAAEALFNTRNPSKAQKEGVRTRLKRMVERGEAEECFNHVDHLTAYRLPEPPGPHLEAVPEAV
jgi:replicative DNA helicase